jgi:hypothetical protein
VKICPIACCRILGLWTRRIARGPRGGLWRLLLYCCERKRVSLYFPIATAIWEVDVDVDVDVDVGVGGVKGCVHCASTKDSHEHEFLPRAEVQLE